MVEDEAVEKAAPLLLEAEAIEKAAPLLSPSLFVAPLSLVVVSSPRSPHHVKL